MPPKKSKGGFGISKTYRPRLVEPELVEQEPKEDEEVVFDEEKEFEPPTTRKKGKKVVEEEDENNVRNFLFRIARTAFEVEDNDDLPQYVQDLASELSMDDADVFWEFASMSKDAASIQDRTNLTDFYENIKHELQERLANPVLRNKKNIPHYASLIFVSPLLSEFRKADEERDGQLLRKDKPVRGAIYCPQCKDNLISTRQVQLRGLDEPSTNIYTCYNYSCNNIWSV